MKDKISQALRPSGLNLSAILPVSELQEQWIERLPEFGHLQRRQQSLLLVGNAGPAFWTACGQLPDWEARIGEQADPLDSLSIEATNQALLTQLPSDECQLLYPVLPGAGLPACEISLQALGRLAGWHQPSPLGIGIRRDSGLWFAYRALFLLDRSPAQLGGSDVQAVQSELPQTSSVCAACATQDCIAACPASALCMDAAPELQRCLDHRLQESSTCADRCLSRNACPVAKNLRYTEEQIRYHYTISLDSIRRWVNKN